MSGCYDPGTSETAETSIRTGVVNGGVDGNSTRAPNDRNSGVGDTGARDAGPAIAIQPEQMQTQQSSQHAAASTLPGDELHITAKSNRYTSGQP